MHILGVVTIIWICIRKVMNCENLGLWATTSLGYSTIVVIAPLFLEGFNISELVKDVRGFAFLLPGRGLGH